MSVIYAPIACSGKLKVILEVNLRVDSRRARHAWGGTRDEPKNVCVGRNLRSAATISQNENNTHHQNKESHL